MNRLAIITTVLLVAALTAAPVAAANTVRSIDIVDGEVKTPDLARSAVTNKKLASNSVNGAKLAENTLALVPNANNLDGRDSTSFVGGAARIVAGQASINRGAFGAIFTAAFADEIGFNVAYQCPGGSPAVPGRIELRNKSGTAWQVWYQDGGDEPVFTEVAGLGTAQFGATEQFHSVKIRLARKFATGQATVYFSINDALATCKANGLVMLFS
jgi:hypothetical protein